MNQQHDGWVIKSKQGYFLPYTFRRTRKESIAAFGTLWVRFSWRKYRKMGWRCVKVKLTEIGPE